MRLASADDQRSFREGGLRPMSSHAAFTALGDLLRSATTNAMVADIDWAILKPLHEARRLRPFLSRMNAPAPAQPAASDRTAAALIERWRTAAVELRHDLLLAFVGDEVATVL